MKTYTIAGLRLVLDLPPEEVFEALTPSAYRYFEVAAPAGGAGAESAGILPALGTQASSLRFSGPALPITIRPGSTRSFDLASVPPLFRMGDAWVLFRQLGQYSLVVAPENPAGPTAVGSFNPESGIFSVVYNDTIAYGCRREARAVPHPFEYPIDRMLLTYSLGHRGGLLCHAVAAGVGGGGYLFPGLSGAGKSTLARILVSTSSSHSPWEVLSDERIAIRLVDERFAVFGTPWPGEAGLASPAGYPLRALIFLRHAPSNTIKDIAPSSALVRLLPLLTVGWYDPELMGRQLAVLEALVSAVPSYELGFVPDRSVLLALDDFTKNAR